MRTTTFVTAAALLTMGGLGAALLKKPPVEVMPVTGTTAPLVQPEPVPPAEDRRRSDATGAVPETRPAWMNEAVPVPAVPSASVASNAGLAEQARQARLRTVMQRFQKLQAQQNPDPREVDEALADLERANGSNVMQGLRLDVLRDNLRVANQLQAVAQELQALQQRAVPPEGLAAHRDALNRKLAEIETLQRQLRMDLQAGQPATQRP